MKIAVCVRFATKCQGRKKLLVRVWQFKEFDNKNLLEGAGGQLEGGGGRWEEEMNKASPSVVVKNTHF